MHLSREQILEASRKLPFTDVPVPELGGDVRLTAMTANARMDWEKNSFPDGTADLREYSLGLIARSLIGDDGKPMFSTDEIGEFAQSSVVTLADAARKLNGIGAEAVAEVEGKSEGSLAASGDSNSLGASGSPTLT